jgi:hypothetical protein
MNDSDDYIEGMKKGIPMGYCLGCSHAYPLVDMNKQGLCEDCVFGHEVQALWKDFLPEEGEEE